VATSPALDGDGVLDPANVVAVGALHPGDNPDVYSGPVPGSYASTAGQYWVQYSFPSSETEVCGGAGVPCTVASQVIAFSVSGSAAPPPSQPAPPTAPTTPSTPTQSGSPPPGFVLPVSPPLEPLKVWPIADAKRTIPGIIRKNTNRSPRALRRNCYRAGLFGFQCRTTWHDAKYKFNGIFRLRINNRTHVESYRFLGKRARRSCLAKARYKSHCQFDWAF